MNTEHVPKPGQLVYRSLDGESWEWLGAPWDAADRVNDLDLMNLRAKCVHTLRKVEDQLESRGLLGRVT